MNSKSVAFDNDYNFKSVAEFKESLLHGREIVFQLNGIEYGIFFEGEDDKAICFGESNKDNYIFFKTVDDLLNCDIRGQLLKDVITQVTVLHRNI